MMTRASLLVTTALLLTGCVTSTKEFSATELQLVAGTIAQEAVADQTPVTAKIDLYEAMARAIKYNLDTKVESMEEALRISELDLRNYDVLPKLVASSGYTARGSVDGASTATRDRSYNDADLTFSWNILDFGLSYVRAKQAGDKVWIQREIKRKIVNRSTEDVRTAYWRAVTYDRLSGRMRTLSAKVKTALGETRSLAANGNTSPIAALSYERELLQIQRELEILLGQLQVAKSQLAALMNLLPNEQYNLVVPDRKPMNLGVSSDYKKLYMTALEIRPEMRQLAYELRINDRELDAQLLQLLPGLQLYAGTNFDSNSFLQESNWIGWGAKASWNMLRLFSIPSTKRTIEAQEDLLHARSMSVAMAIMTQVHVSRVRFLHAKREHGTATELAIVQRKLLSQVKAEQLAERTSTQVLLREEMNSIVTESKLDMVYADLQNAYANLYASLGVDPFPKGMSSTDELADMAAKLRTMWTARGNKPEIVLTSYESPRN